MWLLIGFLFSREYLRLPVIGCLIAGIVLMIIIIQVERQIILGTKNAFTTVFRVVLGLVMALLGSVIVDQIIFKEDIQKEKILHVNNEVAQILPQKLNEINIQISELDSLIVKKQKEREDLIEEVTKRPTIKLPSSQVQRIPSTHMVNGIEKDTILVKRTYTTESIPNPKASTIPSIDKQIEGYLKKKSELHNKIVDVRERTETEILNTKGFLDELKIMKNILKSSVVSMVVWGLWLFFFLIIELFVLFSKLFDKENDYETIIKHQMAVKIDAINKMTNFE